MSLALVAQALPGGSLAQWAIWLIIFAAIVALVFLALRTMGVTVPPFVVQAGWIVIVALVAILAIIFLVRLVGAI